MSPRITGVLLKQPEHRSAPLRKAGLISGTEAPATFQSGGRVGAPLLCIEKGRPRSQRPPRSRNIPKSSIGIHCLPFYYFCFGQKALRPATLHSALGGPCGDATGRPGDWEPVSKIIRKKYMDNVVHVMFFLLPSLYFYPELELEHWTALKEVKM